MPDLVLPAVYLHQEELARRWKVSPRTLERWRYEGRLPRWHRVHGRVLYRLSDVEQFEATCAVERAPW
jgi:predicted site-specific integrase-resolvase